MQCISEDSDGLPDLTELERQLQRHRKAPLLLGTFTAGSNVTGIMPDVHALAKLMHSYGGYAVFDYASAASSCTINCSDGLAPDVRLDAVMLSPHKFPGGPGTTGALVIRDEIIKEMRPQVAGALMPFLPAPRQHTWQVCTSIAMALHTCTDFPLLHSQFILTPGKRSLVTPLPTCHAPAR